jgi:hypothetical protein
MINYRIKPTELLSNITTQIDKMTTPEEVINRVRTVSTAVRRFEERIHLERRSHHNNHSELLLPEQRILQRFAEGRGSYINIGFGIMRQRILGEFLQLYDTIEGEDDSIRKGNWIIAKEQVIQLYMKFWKGTKREDELSPEMEPQLKEIKHQLRLNHIEKQRTLGRTDIPNEEECSLFEEMNSSIQQEITENEEIESMDTDAEYLIQLFQEWNQ